MKIVYVYGGLGYIGLSVCLMLKSLNYKVFCINRKASSTRLVDKANYLAQNKIYVIDKEATDLSVFKKRKPNLIINLIQSTGRNLDTLLDNDLKIHTLLLNYLSKNNLAAGYIYISNHEQKSQIGAIKTAMDAISEYFRNSNNKLKISSICMSPIIDVGMNCRQTAGAVMYHFARTNQKYCPNKEFIHPIDKKKAVLFISTCAHSYLNGLSIKDRYILKGDEKLDYNQLLDKENEHKNIYQWIKSDIVKQNKLIDKRIHIEFWATFIIVILTFFALYCIAF